MTRLRRGRTRCRRLRRLSKRMSRSRYLRIGRSSKNENRKTRCY